jgi:hypothetical protein
MVWNLWSERRLHIKFTTEKQVLGVFSLQIACNYDDENSGSVAIKAGFILQKPVFLRLVYTLLP